MARAAHRLPPALRRDAWIVATVAGSVAAWSAGMAIGSGIGDRLDVAATLGWAMLAGGATIGIIAGALLSGAQVLALAPHAPRAAVGGRTGAGTALWVPAHCLGWAFSMMVCLVGLELIDAAGPLALQIAGGAAVGLAMGATAAGFTGVALVRLSPLASAPPRQGVSPMRDAPAA
jgi:hypothetical protein